MIVIKKGTCPSAFVLKNGKKIVLQVGIGCGDFLNVIKDEDWQQLMKEYGSFITPRIRSEKNPSGCFIVNEKKAYAEDFAKEVGEFKDGSAQMTEEEAKAVLKKKRKKCK